LNGENVAEMDARAARVLLTMTLPGHAVFSALTYLFSGDSHGQFSAPFIAVYFMAALCQVCMRARVHAVRTGDNAAVSVSMDGAQNVVAQDRS
jgi:hypothetical protein